MRSQPLFIAGTQLNHSLMQAYYSYCQQAVVVIGKMTHHRPAKEEIDFRHYVTGLETQAGIGVV